LQIPLVLSGGDTVNADRNTKLLAVNELENYIGTLSNGYLKVFQTYGNHDFNNVLATTSDDLKLSLKQVYNSQIKQREDFSINSPYIDVMKYDNTDKKIRYINFNCSRAKNETIDDNMINKVLAYISELGSDWSVVLLCHAYWTTSSGSTYTVADYYVDKIATLEKTCDASIIALFVGHLHDDMNTTYTATNGGKLLIIGTTTDSYLQNNAIENPPYTMTRGTDTEQAFDIVQIDTTNQHIYLTRVGAGNDRDFAY
jgi:hypothetical protein